LSRGGDFWSRRKAQVEAEAEAQARAAESEARAVREAELAEKSDADICADLGLPDPDTLQPGDDFRAFMAKAVPERLRRRALRRLWLSNPTLANLDGLVDYADDYTDNATVIENLRTAYQVGKGMTAHVEKMARQAETEAKAAEQPEPEDAPQEAEDETPTQVAETEEPYETAEPYAWAEDTSEAEEAAPRRRMQFEFDDTAGTSA
jgi:lysozyme family protein